MVRMANSDRMNILDFVINVLRGHEKNLDALIGRLEGIIATLSERRKEKIGERRAAVGEDTGVITRIQAKVVCDSWSDFRELCSGADIVAFSQDNELRIEALKGNLIYEYREVLPAHVESLRCGITVRLQANLDAAEIKRILSRELNVPVNKIIRGEIYFP